MKKGDFMKIDARVSLPVGRYFVGDVGGVSRPLCAVPARASVFYDDETWVEVEIASGGSTCYDENAFSVFGVCEFEKMVENGVFDEFENGSYGCFEITEPTEILYHFDYLEIVGVMKFSIARENGLLFTSTDDEFETALG
jgi:hypothetical protein